MTCLLNVYGRISNLECILKSLSKNESLFTKEIEKDQDECKTKNYFFGVFKKNF